MREKTKSQKEVFIYGDKKNNGITITRDQFSEAVRDASVKEVMDGMQADPHIGFLVMLLTAKIATKLEKELFGEKED